MPTECCVYGYTNNSVKDKRSGVQRSYFQIPKMKINQGEFVREVTEARRREWISQINRKDLTFDSAKPFHKVCADHFIKGQPAYEMYRQDLDWIPTINLGHASGVIPSGRGTRLAERLHRKKAMSLETESRGTEGRHADDHEEDMEIYEEYMEISSAEPDTSTCSQTERKKVPFIKFNSMEPDHHHLHNMATQTDLTSDLISSMQEELNRLGAENVSLKKDVVNSKFNEKYFEGSDERVKFFTGLPNVTTLMLLFEFFKPNLPGGPRSALSRFDILILTFLRLRFNVPLQLLAYLFHLSRTTASLYFHTTIHAVYIQMLPIIIWPERDVLINNQPNEFKSAFGGRVAVVIDCFKILVETPSDLIAKAQTFSSYKHHNTVKYLIGITPAGAVSYISRGWGGGGAEHQINILMSIQILLAI